jgi:cell division protein FtsZ
MALDFALPRQEENIITALGVGGGGSNAVNNMYRLGISGVDFIVSNTDVQALMASPVPNKLQLGAKLTNGLGSGGEPERGRQSAVESKEEIRRALEKNTRMLFLTAGMGGGTGTGAAPVIAGIAKEMGILTVGIVTIPFYMEGAKRLRSALAGLEELEKHVDSLIVIKNDNIRLAAGRDMKLHEGLLMVDRVLYDAARGIAEIITKRGLINVDFADVCAIMRDSKCAVMGMGTARGDDRAVKALTTAISSPLLDNPRLDHSTGMIVNITSGEDFTLDEFYAVMEKAHNFTGASMDNIIVGHTYADEDTDVVNITVIATGFERVTSLKPQTPARPTAHATPTPSVATAPPVATTAAALSASQTSVTAPETPIPAPPEPVAAFVPPSDTPSQERTPIHERIPAPESPAFSPKPAPLPTPTPIETAQHIRYRDIINQAKSPHYDYRNPAVLKNLEDTPAFERLQRELIQRSDNSQTSKYSVYYHPRHGTQLTDANAAIYRDVD